MLHCAFVFVYGRYGDGNILAARRRAVEGATWKAFALASEFAAEIGIGIGTCILHCIQGITMPVGFCLVGTLAQQATSTPLNISWIPGELNMTALTAL